LPAIPEEANSAMSEIIETMKIIGSVKHYMNEPIQGRGYHQKALPVHHPRVTPTTAG
jgi:hypothetical protein